MIRDGINALIELGMERMKEWKK